MTFLELAKNRFSTRRFQDTPVEEDKVKKILLAAKHAPTAKNQQPQKIYIVRSTEALEKLNSLSPCIYGAPLVFIVAYDKNLDWKNPMEDGVRSGEIDASIVATHMMMAATELGLGTCWIGMFPPTEIAKAFNMPEHIRPVMLLPTGYTQDTFRPAPLHNQFRDIDEIVTDL